MNSADCRCLLECLLISLGQPAEVKGHIVACLFVVSFLFDIQGRCSVLIQAYSVNSYSRGGAG